MPRIEVRAARTSDAHAVRVLRARAIRESAADSYDAAALEAWASGASDSEIRQKIEKTSGFVAIAHRKVIGWANLEGDEVGQLYVDPAYGGIGVARALYGAIEAVAAQRGARQLTTVASVRSIPVFRRFGFTEVRTQDRVYDAHSYRVADMTKPLGDH